MKKKVRSLINGKLAKDILGTAAIIKEISPRLESDSILLNKFSDTIRLCKLALEKVKTGGGCPSCKLNNEFPEILPAFVSEFKRLSDDMKTVAIRHIGERVWISHGATQSWVNFVTNSVEKFLYEEREYEIEDSNHPNQNVMVNESLNDSQEINSNIVDSSNNSVEKVDTKNSTENKLINDKRTVDERRKEFLEKRAKATELAREANLKKNGLTKNDVTSSTQVQVSSSVQKEDKKRKVIFKNFQAPGDIVMMTAAIRDLHLNHPGKFITDVRTNSMSIWESNPYITKLDENDPEVEVYKAEYPLIQQSNQGPYHFSEGFTENFESLLGIRISRRIGRGHIVIGQSEDGWGWTERKTWFDQYGLSPDIHYWILNAGYKNDFTAKMWPVERYQKIVDHFAGKISFVQIGHKSHNHPEMTGTINLVGKTDDRQLIRLVWASSGVLTPCSYPMTLAAAVPVKVGTCNGRSDRPCVIVAGGREPSHWQAHTNHQFVHTCGMLPCCSNGGCWKSRVKPIGDGDEKDKKNLCEYVVNTQEGVELPFCMDMITAEEIIRRIEMYYKFYEPSRPKTHTYNLK